MRRLPVFILLLFSTTAFSQTSDFIILKKKDKTIRSYYAGTQIEFVSTGGAYRNALITGIRNDSIFLQEFLVRQVQTALGFYVTDTAGSFHYAYNYREIASIGKKQKGFNVNASGASLFGGGVVLTLASGVVYLVDRKKFSPGLLIASAALGTAGYFLMKSGSKGIVIGKKNYRLEYMQMSGTK